MTVRRTGCGLRDSSRPVARSSTPFAMALMAAVALIGLTRLIGTHMTRDPLGAASAVGLAALAGVPCALVLAMIRDGGPGRIALSGRPAWLVVRAGSKAVFLAAMLLHEDEGWVPTMVEFTGYGLAAVIAAVVFRTRVPPRDAIALSVCLLGTVGILAPGFLMTDRPPLSDIGLGLAVVALGTFVAATHRLAPEDGVATLLFWDSIVSLTVVLTLAATGDVVWDGAPLHQAAAVVIATVAAAGLWIAAYSQAPVSRLAPFEFLALPAMLGVAILFGQQPPPVLVLGFLAVLPACAGLALREMWLVRRRGAGGR